MAKKITKKVNPEKQVEIIENSNNKIIATEESSNFENIKENIDNVDVELESNVDNNIEKITEAFNKELKPMKEITDEISKLTNNEVLNEKMSNASAKEIETYINDEIKKTKNLIEKVEKIKEHTNTKLNTGSVTNWWNGMGYDL